MAAAWRGRGRWPLVTCRQNSTAVSPPSLTVSSSSTLRNPEAGAYGSLRPHCSKSRLAMEWRRSAGFTLIALRTLLANYPTRHRWMSIPLIVCASHQPLLELWLSHPEPSLCNIGTPSTRLRSRAVSQRCGMGHLGTKRGLAKKYPNRQTTSYLPQCPPAPGG